MNGTADKLRPKRIESLSQKMSSTASLQKYSKLVDFIDVGFFDVHTMEQLVEASFARIVVMLVWMTSVQKAVANPAEIGVAVPAKHLIATVDFLKASEMTNNEMLTLYLPKVNVDCRHP